MKLTIALLLLGTGLAAQPRLVIDTVAGFDPDGVRAREVGLAAVVGLAVDAKGNVYFSQPSRQRVYRVTPEGVLEAVAREARLDSPGAVAVDEAGNLYIAAAAEILAVSAETGEIRTVVKLEEGGALKSITWMAAAPGGRLIVADREARMLKSVDVATGAVSHVAGSGKNAIQGDNGPATVAALQAPAAVAVDGVGNIYYAELFEPRVRRIDAATGTITTRPLMIPDEDIPAENEVVSALATDAAGNLYAVQMGRERVLKITPDGDVSVAARGLTLPRSVAMTAAGELLVAEFTPGRIVRVPVEGGREVLAGNGLTLYNGDGLPALETQLAEPAGVAVAANGDVFVSSALADRVVKIEPAGTVKTVLGGGMGLEGIENPTPLDARLTRPQALLLDGNGDLLVSDYDNRLVWRASGDGAALKLEYEAPVANVSIGAAVRQAGALVSDGTRTYLSSPSDHHVWVMEPERVKVLAGTGEAGFEGDGGLAKEARLKNPSGLARDAEGNLYIADMGNHRIRKVDAATGTISTVWPAGEVDEASLPSGLAFDAAGALYVADAGLHKVWKIDLEAGKAEVVAGTGEAGFSGDGGAASEARLNRPCALAFDKDGRLYIADTGNQRVRRVSLAE